LRRLTSDINIYIFHYNDLLNRVFMESVTQIKVGKHRTGIVGLDKVLKEMSEMRPQMSEKEIASKMIEKLSKKNYIPSEAYDKYSKAFIREQKKYMGEPIPEDPLEAVEIKVLGAGCPNCDKLETTLMELIEEMGIAADLEHVRDMKEIAKYGVMGSPALVVNRKVKAMGSVPPKPKLKNFILQAATELDE
jgi:small redox-active disulfide protein 2